MQRFSTHFVSAIRRHSDWCDSLETGTHTSTGSCCIQNEACKILSRNAHSALFIQELVKAIPDVEIIAAMRHSQPLHDSLSPTLLDEIAARTASRLEARGILPIGESGLEMGLENTPMLRDGEPVVYEPTPDSMASELFADSPAGSVESTPRSAEGPSGGVSLLATAGGKVSLSIKAGLKGAIEGAKEKGLRPRTADRQNRIVR